MASRAWLSQQRQRERAEQDAAARALESQREQVEETLAACAALLEAGGGGGAGGAGDAAAAAQCVLARLLDLRTLARCPLPDATKLLAALQPALRRIYSMESMVEAVVCSWGELSSWLLHPGQQRAHQQDASATADAAQLEAQLQQLAQADSHVLGLLVQLLASFVAVTGCNPLQDPPAACAARCTALLVHAALALPTEHDGPEHDDGNHPLLAPAVVGSMLSVLRSGPLAELRLMHAEQQRSPSTATRLPPLLAPSSRHNSLHPPSPPQERPGGPADAEEEGGDGGEGEAHAPYGAQAFGLALSLAQSPCFDALHRLEEQRGAQWGSGSGGIGGGGRRAGSGASRAQLLYRCLAGLVAACCGGLGGSGGAEGGDAGGQRLLGQCLLTSLVGLLPVVAATAQPGAGGGGAGEGGWDEWAETCAGHRVLCALACAPGLPALACALMHATGGSQGRAQGGEAVLQLLRRLHEGQDQAPRLLEVLVELLRPESNCALDVRLMALHMMRDAARQRACRGEGEEEEGAGGQVAGVWADGDGGAARTQYVVEVVLFTAMHDASAKIRRACTQLLATVPVDWPATTGSSAHDRRAVSSSVAWRVFEVLLAKCSDKDAQVRSTALRRLLLAWPREERAPCAALAVRDLLAGRPALLTWLLRSTLALLAETPAASGGGDAGRKTRPRKGAEQGLAAAEDREVAQCARAVLAYLLLDEALAAPPPLLRLLQAALGEGEAGAAGAGGQAVALGTQALTRACAALASP